jgi:hypothetical protein
MTETLMQGAIWMIAGGCLLFFLKRRKAAKKI